MAGIIPPQKQKVPVVTGTHFFTCESYQSSNRLVKNKISSPVWSVAPPFRVASCLGLTFLSRQSGKGHLHWTLYIKLLGLSLTLSSLLSLLFFLFAALA